jgi:hypothetical protein
MSQRPPASQDESLRQASYWRDRAEEARTMGEGMRDPVSKAVMMDIAEKYDLMARRASERESRPKK